MSKYYRVYADVDLDAIRANCIELMSKTEPSTKALAVVKADGYGHGDVAVSKLQLQKQCIQKSSGMLLQLLMKQLI